MIEQGKHRLRQARNPRDGAKQAETHHESEHDADALRACALRFGQLVAQNGNEDQVVDAEHDFHHDECHECRPCSGIGDESQQRVHLRALLSGVERKRLNTGHSLQSE
jgi:hypothetical protein